MAERQAYRVMQLKGEIINMTGRPFVVSGEVEWMEDGVIKKTLLNPGYRAGYPVSYVDFTIASASSGENVFRIDNETRSNCISPKEDGIYYFVTKEVADAYFRRDDFYFIDFTTGFIYSYFPQEQ
jgi:hypothetical protein